MFREHDTSFKKNQTQANPDPLSHIEELLYSTGSKTADFISAFNLCSAIKWSVSHFYF